MLEHAPRCLNCGMECSFVEVDEKESFYACGNVDCIAYGGPTPKNDRSNEYPLWCVISAGPHEIKTNYDKPIAMRMELRWPMF